MTKATATPLKGAVKECPSCGADIQGKTNKNGSVFFNCYSKINKDTGKHNPDGIVGDETCAYRECFGRVMSKQIKQQFNEVSANEHIKSNGNKEENRTTDTGSSSGESAGGALPQHDRGTTSPTLTGQAEQTEGSTDTGKKSFWGGIESAFD